MQPILIPRISRGFPTTNSPITPENELMLFLKINGWFRCISYLKYIVPFFLGGGGGFVHFGGM